MAKIAGLLKAIALLWLASQCVGAFAQATTPYMVGQTTNSGSAAGKTVTLSVPTSAAVGDLLLAQVAAASLSACSNITPPTGWTLTVPCNPSATHIVQGVYSKTATASDLGASPSWTLSSSVSFAGNMLAYRDVLGIDVGGDQANASSGTVTAPSVTTTVANDVVVVFFASSYGNGETITPSTANVETGTALSSTGNGGAGAVAGDYFQLTAGATGTQTATLGRSAYSIGAQVALKPVVTEAACSPPSTVVAALGAYSSGTYTCYCDSFNRSALSPSPIYNASWVTQVSNGTFGVPRIVAPGRLRLTDNSGNDASSATAPGIFPAAGNYISVEFNHYAYNGSGADGVGVILSDSSVPVVPGGYGGAQGYAPENTPGFAGGWLGVALDEFGNYANPADGRPDGPGFIAEEVGMRGPGSGNNGYLWIAGSGGLGNNGIDNHTSVAPSWGNKYQVIIDARNESTGTINVAVNRDTTTKDGTNYSSVVPATNAYSFAQNAVTKGWWSYLVPPYWQVSFTSSTGGSTNYHEIGNFRVCAQTEYPTTGQTASGFSAIDSHYSTSATPAYGNFQTGHIYTKLTATPFQLWVAALTSTNVATGYSATTNKYVQVNLVPNIVSGQTKPCSVSCTSACTSQSPVEKPGGTQNLTFTTSSTTPGAVLSSSFTLNSAYQDLIAVMRECNNSTCSGTTPYTSTAAACSVDDFSVRPQGLTIASGTNNTAITGTPALRAGDDTFTVTATTAGVAGVASNYTGTLSVGGIQSIIPATGTPGTITPAVFPAATSATPSSIITGTFTYSDVGVIGLEGTSATTIGGVTVSAGYPPFASDQIWTGVDSGTQKDCVTGTTIAAYSNTINGNGQYGCYFGNAAGIVVGRFRPDHYALVSSTVTPAITSSTPFTYMGQTIPVIAYQLEACSGIQPACSATKNYDASLGYPVVAPVMVAEDMAPANMGYNLISRLSLGKATVPAAPAWSQGYYTVSTTSPSTAVFSLPSSQPGGLTSAGVANAGGPFNSLEIGVNMTDGDTATIYNNDMNVNISTACSSTGIACTAKQIGTTTAVREGRLVIANGYGSQNLTLPVTVSAQYFTSNSLGGAWSLNSIDTGGTTTGATVIPAGGAILNNANAAAGAAAAPCVVFVASQGATSTTCTLGTPYFSSSALSLTNGQATYYLYDVNNNAGTVDLAIDLGIVTYDKGCLVNVTSGAAAGNMTWLQYLWCGGTSHDPAARMKFGASKTPYIYLREMY